MYSVLVSKVAITNTTDWLKRQNFFFLRVLEIGSSRSRCWQVWFLLWLEMAALWPGPHVDFSSVPRLPGVPSSSCKDTNPTGSGPTPLPSLNLNYLFKGLISKQSHWGLRRSHMNLGDTVQSITYSFVNAHAPNLHFWSSSILLETGVVCSFSLPYRVPWYIFKQIYYIHFTVGEHESYFQVLLL